MNMYYEGQELVSNYRHWLEANTEAIDAKLAEGIAQADPKKAIESVIHTMLNDILPMALAEMMLFNNSKLEEAIAKAADPESGCGSCTSCG